MKGILILNGGTTNLRATLLDSESRTVLASASADGGVRNTAIEGTNERLRRLTASCIADVLQQTGMTPGDIRRTIAYGMITSGVGLYEIPHLAAPVNPAQLHAGMRQRRWDDIAPLNIEFIPGVRNFSDTVTAENVGTMDMMRGEEVEAVGLFDLLKRREETLFVLPGSHNKFVHMDAEGRILGCMTSISGELLDAVTHHTILAGSVEHGFCTAETYARIFALHGAKECRESGLGRAAFAGRILQTLGSIGKEEIRSFLLGAVLAEDVKALQSFVGEQAMPQVFVAGKQPLKDAFCDVMTFFGYECCPVDEETGNRMGIHGALLIAE